MTAPEPEAAPAPAWTIKKADTAGPGDGPSWRTEYVTQALKRIESAPSAETAAVQALTEQVAVLHSIRRILIWTLVLVPLILTVIGIILMVTGQTAEPKDCGFYGTRC